MNLDSLEGHESHFKGIAFVTLRTCILLGARFARARPRGLTEASIL